MINYFKKLLGEFFTSYKSVSTLVKTSLPEHSYRVLSIERDENNHFIAIIQIRNKKEIFRMHPEEILASDSITDSFSQKDIRTLTYLGYLGINSPRYKILAKRLSENDTKLLFAIEERGNKNLILKTAREISTDETLITGLHQKDAHMIGYAVASEQSIDDNAQKKYLSECHEKIV